MRPRYGAVALWSVGLGVLTGAVAGSLVTTANPTRTLQFVGGAIVLATATLAVVLSRRSDPWTRRPVVRSVVYFVALLVATVALDGLATQIIAGPPLAVQVAEVVAITAGFGVALWIACYGGAERCWRLTIDALGVDW